MYAVVLVVDVEPQRQRRRQAQESFTRLRRRVGGVVFVCKTRIDVLYDSKKCLGLNVASFG